MTPAEILRRRLENQGLAHVGFRAPEKAVAWFGAVQAQDYLGSLWALGQRTRDATEASVEAAEARRAIVETHKELSLAQQQIGMGAMMQELGSGKPLSASAQPAEAVRLRPVRAA